jgi:hypothetical protein
MYQAFAPGHTVQLAVHVLQVRGQRPLHLQRVLALGLTLLQLARWRRGREAPSWIVPLPAQPSRDRQRVIYGGPSCTHTSLTQLRDTRKCIWAEDGDTGLRTVLGCQALAQSLQQICVQLQKQSAAPAPSG